METPDLLVLPAQHQLFQGLQEVQGAQAQQVVRAQLVQSDRLGLQALPVVSAQQGQQALLARLGQTPLFPGLLVPPLRWRDQPEAPGARAPRVQPRQCRAPLVPPLRWLVQPEAPGQRQQFRDPPEPQAPPPLRRDRLEALDLLVQLDQQGQPERPQHTKFRPNNQQNLPQPVGISETFG